MKYLKGTKYMKLTPTVDTMSVIKWWEDALHHTHMEYRDHTGAIMTLGKGATISHSVKHKLNTKSSTESKLVGDDDMLVNALWGLYFIQSQGYTFDQNIMYQDNMTTMRLEINGTLSSYKRTKHIKASYFSLRIKWIRGR